MKKVKVYLCMNALLEPKLLNPRKIMICWKPNPITSLESPLDSILCVHCCMIWDEMQRLELVLAVYDGISLNTWTWVKQWLWGFGWWSMPFITLLLSSYHLWLGFLNLTRTNPLFLFSCFTLPRYKAFPKWEVRCLKILLKFLFHIIGSILHFRPCFYIFWGFSVPFMPSIFLSIMQNDEYLHRLSQA